MEKTREKIISRWHFSVSKTYLIESIERNGAKSSLGDDCPLSKEQAIQEVRDDGREFFTIGNCDNQNKDGSCAGHYHD